MHKHIPRKIREEFSEYQLVSLISMYMDFHTNSTLSHPRDMSSLSLWNITRISALFLKLR